MCCWQLSKPGKYTLKIQKIHKRTLGGFRVQVLTGGPCGVYPTKLRAGCLKLYEIADREQTPPQRWQEIRAEEVHGIWMMCRQGAWGIPGDHFQSVALFRCTTHYPGGPDIYPIHEAKWTEVRHPLRGSRGRGENGRKFDVECGDYESVRKRKRIFGPNDGKRLELVEEATRSE